MPVIRRNVERKGIEIVFPGKPVDEIRTYLKSIGFQWSPFAKVWCKKFNDADWKLIHEYFGVPLPEPSITTNPELPIGTAIEKEHTDSPAVAEKIATDHLKENPNYYSDPKPKDWAEKELQKEAKPSTMKETTMYYKVKTKSIPQYLKFLKELKPYATSCKIFSAGIGDEYLIITGDYDKMAAMHPSISVTDFDSVLSDSKDIQSYKRLNRKPNPQKSWKGKWVGIDERIAHLENVLSDDDEAETIIQESDQTMQEVEQEIKDEQVPNTDRISKQYTSGFMSNQEEKDEAAEMAMRKVIENLYEPGTIRPPFMKENILKGREIQLSMPNGEKRNAIFAIVELDNIITSHNEENFHSEPLYPKNASGNNINDRNYSGDLSAQKAVMDYARELEPERLITTSRTPSGTPIVTKDGFVVSGNNRTMSLKLAAKQYPENYKEYVKFLSEEIESFGFPDLKFNAFSVGGSVKGYVVKDPKEINELPLTFTHPVLVRIDLDFPEYTTQELAKYNKDTKKSERPIDKAIKLSNILRDNSRCADIIAATVGEYDTFSEFYVNVAGQKRLAKTLVECNLLTEQELPAFFSETTFTEAGKEFIESLLAALVLDREALMATEQPGVKSTRQKLITSLPVLMKNASLPEGSLKQKINDAVILQYNMKGSTFADFIRQRTMFGTIYDKQTVYLNRLIDSGKLKFKAAIEGYNDAIMKNQGASLFGEKPSLDEIFNHWIVGGVSETDKKLIESSDVVSKGEVFGTFAGQVPAESMQKAWKENTPIKEVFEAAGKEYPQPEIIPHDGWRDHLIKARSYAIQLFTKEELDDMRDKDSMDWGDRDSIVRMIDKKLNPQPELRKEFLREQEGLKIYLVDGEAIRKSHIEFVSGGHGYVYDWIPKDEVWIDDNQKDKPDDMEATIKHELFEIKKMRDEGLSYDEAHELANAMEKEERNKDAGGERKIFGYSFMFQPANEEGLKLMAALQGFGMIIGVLDYPNGISIEYRTEKYELLDNSGEFKVNRIGKEGYPDVIDFKGDDGHLMSVFNLAREIENVILRDIKSVSKPEVKDVFPEIAAQGDKERLIEEIQSLEKNIRNGRKLMLKPSFTGDVTKDIEKDLSKVQVLKQELADLLGISYIDVHKYTDEVSQPETLGDVIENMNPYRKNKIIEELLDRKWNDKDWTAEQLEFIKGYTGYGGLDKEAEKAGATLDRGSLYEFYTPDLVIEKMWALAYKYGYNEGSVLEPAMGVGSFFDRRFVKSHIRKVGYETNKYSAKIASILYPEATIYNQFFEQAFIKNNYTVRNKVSPEHDLVIGNPPYGTAQGLYMGMGEKSYSHAMNYIDYFIFRGLDLLKKDGLLIYIIGAEVAAGGKPWLDQGDSKCKQLIAAKGKLLDAYRLPEGLFDRTNVVTDVIVMRKKI